MKEEQQSIGYTFLASSYKWLIESNSNESYHSHPMRGMGREGYLRYHMPYKLLAIDGGILLLNREYKPLGLTSNRDHVKYEDYQSLFLRPDEISVTLEQLEADKTITHPRSKDYILRHGPFLYYDSDCPMGSAADYKRYMKRIALIFNLGTN